MPDRGGRRGPRHPARRARPDLREVLPPRPAAEPGRRRQRARPLHLPRAGRAHEPPPASRLRARQGLALHGRAAAAPLRRICVTGMSGTGKSTVLAELARLGYDTVETDVAPWSEWSDEAGGDVWDEGRVAGVANGERETTLFVSGTVSNQGRFYDRFDAVVLLSAPAEVLLERIGSRTTNPFGKSAEERERNPADPGEAEPLLRATCTHELDATEPVEAVVAALVALTR